MTDSAIFLGTMLIIVILTKIRLKVEVIQRDALKRNKFYDDFSCAKYLYVCVWKLII